MKLVIREATLEDSADIARLIRAAFHEYAGVIDPPSGAHNETEEQVREKLGTKNALVATLEGQLAGCVMYEVHEDYLYFGRLSVLPEYRNGGFARALLEAVEHRATDLGFARVQLGVRVALPRLRTHYERHGYRVIEERCHEGYSEPTYLQMEKSL